MVEESMNGLQKVAVLLKSLPAETVDKVLKHMDPHKSKLLVSELSRIAADPNLAAKIADVLDEAAAMLHAPETVAQPVPAQPMIAPVQPPPSAAVETVVDLNIDDELAARMRPVPAPASQIVGQAFQPATSHGKLEGLSHADPLRALAAIPCDVLAKAMENENARTIFIVMENLTIETAGQIYKLLSPARRKEVSLRFTEKVALSEPLVRHIAQGMLKKCQALLSAKGPANPDEERQQRMAALLNRLERSERMEMLAMLAQTDPGLTERVKNLLYQFEVIARMENTSVQKLLSEVNMQSLAVALKGAAPEIEERIMSNLSRRAQETLREEVSLVGNVLPAKIAEARQSIVQVIQQLDDRGDFILRE